MTFGPAPRNGVFGNRIAPIPVVKPRTATPALKEIGQQRSAPDPEAIRDGTLVLVPIGQATLTAIPTDGGMGPTKTFHMPEGIDAAVRWATDQNCAGMNVYICANESARVDCKSKAADIQDARFCWADIDPKVSTSLNYESATQDLREILLPIVRSVASAVIGTGNGMQAYFRLRPTADLKDPAIRKRYERVNDAIGTKFEGPGTFNADRILRLPGTLNFPNPAKLRKGYPAAPSVAKLLYECEKTYTLEALEQLAGLGNLAATTSASPDVQARFQTFLSSNEKANGRYNGDIAGLTDTSGSGRDFSMVAMLRLAGFSLDETRMLLEDWEYGSSIGRNQGERYWQRMYRKAGEDTQFEFGEAPPTAVPAPPRFRLRSVAELVAEPQPAWLIKEIIPDKGLASVFGQSGSGKTFLILSMLACIAKGTDWFGRKVRAAPVIYVALEGAGGISKRLQAWEKHHNDKLPPAFQAITDHLSLFNNGDIPAFIDVLAECGFKSGIIVIDTLNAAAPGADENTSQDMGKIIHNAVQLQRATDSIVILIHHSGKDQSKGLRGHSSLTAALDCAIEVKKEGGNLWQLTKSKDSVDGISHPFKLVVVPLGKDADGDEITSCVAVPDFATVVAGTRRKPKGSNQQIALNTVKELILGLPTGTTQKRIPIEDAVEAIGSRLAVDPKRRHERARAAINGLVADGHLIHRDSCLCTD